MDQNRRDIQGRVRRRLGEFLAKDGRPDQDISHNTNMIHNLGLTSLQGLEFVLDLCDEFGVELPHEFNPFVNDAKRRGRTFDEMVSSVESYLQNEGSAHEQK